MNVACCSPHAFTLTYYMRAAYRLIPILFFFFYSYPVIATSLSHEQLQIDGEINATINTETSLLTQPWQLILQHPQSQIISWHIAMDCHFTLLSGSASNITLTYFEAEDKIIKPLALTADAPQTVTITAESSKPQLTIHFDFTESKNTEISYHCDNLTIKVMTEPHYQATDVFKLQITPATKATASQ